MLHCCTGTFDNNLILRSTANSMVMKITDELLPGDIDLTPYLPKPNITTLANPKILTAVMMNRLVCGNKCLAEFEPAQEQFPRCPECGHRAALLNFKLKEQCLTCTIRSSSQIV